MLLYICCRLYCLNTNVEVDVLFANVDTSRVSINTPHVLIAIASLSDKCSSGNNNNYFCPKVSCLYKKYISSKTICDAKDDRNKGMCT